MSEQLPEGLTPIVVEPGSADDPFTARTQVVSPNAVVSPTAANSFGTPTPVQSEGTQVQPSNATPPTNAAPPVSPPAPSPSIPENETPMQAAIREGKLEEYIAGLVQKQAEPAIRHYQSVADRQVADLQRQLREAREAETRRVRDAKLSDENLTDDEKAVLKDKWALEDEREQLRADIEEGDSFFKSMYAAELAREAGQFGVTAAQLEQFDEPEQMDAFVAQAELAWYKAGNLPTASVPNNAVQATPTGAAPAANAVVAAPAGASAPTDVGGGAPAAPAAKPEQGQGIDVMARNLNMSEWVSVPLPN